MIRTCCSGEVSEVMTSAKKKCLKRTLPNGEMMMWPRVRASCLRPFSWKQLNGMKQMKRKKTSRLMEKYWTELSAKCACSLT